ncbi:MAG: Lrp/AsnC family transcriptional regulator [Actinomycetota bacterium]
MQLDATDRAILNEVQASGRVTNAELAGRVGLSASAALRRTRALEQAGVIAGYVALVDRAAIGRGTTVFVEISVATQSEAQLDGFEAAITEVPEVISCHLMAGDSDYLVQVACSDVEDYERVHRERLSKLPGVARIRSSFALREVCNRTSFDL